MNQMSQETLQSLIVSQGQKIFDIMAEETGSIFNKDWWYGRIMDWSMQNEGFKIQMFRFVDVLPYLNSSDEIARHLKEYFSSEDQPLPSVLGWGLGLGALAPGLMAGAIKKNVMQMAKMFITGATAEEAFGTLEKLRKNHLCFTVDILGEAAVSEKEAESYFRRYLALIENLAELSKKWPEDELMDRDHLGPISKVNVSVKVSSLFSQFDPIDPENSINAVKEKLRPLFRRAKELGVFLNLDMESFFHKDLTIKLFKSLMDEEEFKNHHNVGMVIQAYLKESLADIEGMIEWAKKRSGRITIRLVKGAYWDYETIQAKQKGWAIPVYTNKKQTDANYERLSLLMLQNDKYLKSAFGSHNVRSISNILVQAEKLGVNKRSFEIQMLYGMAEPIKRSLVHMGFRVREYAPVGELIPGMAYLVRRLLENTSNESFLRAKFTTNLSTQELLKDPAYTNGTGKNIFEPEEIKSAKTSAVKKTIFENEPPIDFNKEENRKAMKDSLAKIKKQFGKTYPLIIGKKEIKTNQEIISVNPADPSVIVGKTSAAGATDADQAIEVAKIAQIEWAKTSADKRAAILEKTGQLMREKKFDLAALEVYEVGKTWREADGDIAEAIDFCDYYAGQMRKLSVSQKVSFVPGEDSQYFYQPRGVGVVIAPWNFPLAILCGMTVGAAVCGNAVIMKPAEQSPIIAAAFMEILKEAGMPPGVINFLPGYGEEVGEYLVNHHKVDFIVFTGSKNVGLQIISKAAKTQPGQQSIKKVVAELGGKNAIIVDSDADLDEAVQGVIYSAFGYQGQKCSACSRVIVLEENYDKFVNRLTEAARSLLVTNPESAGASVGPVVDEEAFDRIREAIVKAKSEGNLLFEAPVPSVGYFISPTIVENIKPDSWTAQNEIFGPVLAVIKVKTFDEALAVANGTEFALTGGVYTRSPAHLEKARREFEVGNLYINRGCTGAIVGRHPFGGFKMSGVGSKAGGPDYLLQFLEPRTITENTMRRGFAPDMETPEPNAAHGI